MENEHSDDSFSIKNLTDEVSKIDKKTRESRKKKEKEGKTGKDKLIALDFDPLDIPKLINNATKTILHEMKAEFYKLFNFISEPPSKMFYTGTKDMIKAIKKNEDSGDTIVESQSLEKKLLLFSDMIEERENLIYELTDQLVNIELEKEEFARKIERMDKEKLEWSEQQKIIAKLIITDRRYNIIDLLRRTKIIAPVQLSFVLGVSLAQTKKYIKELEEIEIIKVNEDDTVFLHPEFNENTMNIIKAIQNKKK